MTELALADSSSVSSGGLASGDDALVVVSIVGFRNPDDVVNCVRALSRSEHVKYVVSVCENGGAEAFDALVKEVGNLALATVDQLRPVDERIARTWSGRLSRGNQPIHLFEAKANIGFAGGVNVTLRQVAADPSWSSVWLLNPDTEPEARALSALVSRARSTGAAIVGSRLVFHDTGRVQLYGGRWRKMLARGFNIGLNKQRDDHVDTNAVEQSMNYVSGASLYATREFIEEVGLMDERYFLYCDEVDWCLKIDPIRLRCASDSIVLHKHGTTIGSSKVASQRSYISVYLSERNRLLLTKQFYPRLYPIVIVITLGLIVQYVSKGAWSNAVIALRGWLAGIRGEIGPPPLLDEKSQSEAGSVRYTT